MSVNPTTDSDVLMSLPMVYIAPLGTISVVLPYNIVIEISVDKTIRIVCYDKFALACNSKGSVSSILHSNARIYHYGEKVYGNFCKFFSLFILISQILKLRKPLFWVLKAFFLLWII